MIVKIERTYSSQGLDAYKCVLDEYKAIYKEEKGQKFATIEITSVEELFTLASKLDQDLVISNFRLSECSEHVIEIYDGYRE